MPSVAFVINSLRVRDPNRFRRRCQAAARAAGWDPTFAETSAGDGGVGAARAAVAAGASLVFAAGGDGTVRACAQALTGTAVPLAIVPLGTANLTARALRIPAQAGRALAAGFGGRDRVIDVACAELGSGAGASGAAYGDGAGAGLAGGGEHAPISFTAMAGIGLDAAVVGAAPIRHKHRIGWVAYAVSGLGRAGRAAG